MVKNGIVEDNLMKLFTHAQIDPKEQDMVRNLSYLGVNVTPEVSTIFNSTAFRIKENSLIIAYHFHISREIVRNHTTFHERNALQSTPIKCHVGHQSLKILWKTVSMINWIHDIFHFWLVVHSLVAVTMRQQGEF